MTKQAGTINLAPTWRSILPILLAGYEHGNADGRRVAMEELHRLCKIADDLNAESAKDRTITSGAELTRITAGLRDYARPGADALEHPKHTLARMLAALDYGDLLEIANIIRKA